MSEAAIFHPESPSTAIVLINSWGGTSYSETVPQKSKSSEINYKKKKASPILTTETKVDISTFSPTTSTETAHICYKKGKRYNTAPVIGVKRVVYKSADVTTIESRHLEYKELSISLPTEPWKQPQHLLELDPIVHEEAEDYVEKMSQMAIVNIIEFASDQI